MESERFQRRLAICQAMPGNSEDTSYLACNYPSPLDAKLDALCSLYLEASATQQETLAGLFTCEMSTAAEQLAINANIDNLLSYIRRVARRIKAVEDCALAQLGLAAAGLAAEGADERDILIACAFLQYAAMQADIDLAPMIEAQAATARPQTQRLLTALRKSDDATLTRIIRYHEGTG